MKLRSFVVLAVLLLMAPASLLGATLRWSRVTEYWDDSRNWYCTGCSGSHPGYPYSTDDDAIVAEADYVITLAEVEIDDLTITNPSNELRGPAFGSDGETETTLRCESVTVWGGDHGAATYVIDRAVITTVPS